MQVSVPGYSARAITASDTTAEPALLGRSPDGFFVNGAGNVTFVTDLGATVTIAAAALTIYPFRIQRINSTGLTATGVLALFIDERR